MNRRLRLTEGVNTGAVSFVQKAPGANVADVSPWVLIANFDPVTFGIPANVNPAGTEHYVVEQCGEITNLFLDVVTEVDDGTGPFEALVIDSVFCPNVSTSYECTAVFFLGCTGVKTANATGQMVVLTVMGALGCSTAGAVCAAVSVQLWACANVGEWSLFGPFVAFQQGSISQASKWCNNSFNASVVVLNDAAVFDSPDTGIQASAGFVEFWGPFWGSGNTGAGFDNFGTQARIVTGFGGAATKLTIAGANDFRLDGKTVARAWDDTAGAYTEAGAAATRTTTWAHLAATIAAGGFAGNAIDVTTGASIITV